MSRVRAAERGRTAPAPNITGQPWAIRALGLSKLYGPRVALRSVSLNLAPGERLAILGPNGAGKSTLIRILSLLSRPSSGSLDVLGFSVAHDANEIRRRSGVVLHESLLYPELSVQENLSFFGRLYQVPQVNNRIAAVMDQLDLGRLGDRRVRELSRGQRQRASLARALIHEPALLLLDEPDTGQDAASLERIQRELTADLQRTVVFATHQPAYALEVATRLLLLQNGRAVELGRCQDFTISDLQRSLSLSPSHL